MNNNIEDILAEMEDIERENREYAEYLKMRRENRLHKGSSLEQSHKIKKLKIYLKAHFIQGLLIGAGITGAILIIPKTGKIMQYLDEKDNQKLEQEYERQRQEVEELTGRSIEEIRRAADSVDQEYEWYQEREIENNSEEIKRR